MYTCTGLKQRRATPFELSREQTVSKENDSKEASPLHQKSKGFLRLPADCQMMDKNRWPSVASANSGFTRTVGTFQAISLSKVMFRTAYIYALYIFMLCTFYFDDL